MKSYSKTLDIDCASPTLIEDILQADSEPPFQFRRIRYVNRNRRSACGNHPLTVAFQYFRFGFGGAEQVTCTLLSVFLSLGYRVLLYVDEPPHEGDYPLPEGVVRKQTEAPFGNPKARVAYWLDEVEKEQIDLVVYSSWHSPTAAIDCMALQAGGAAFVFHTHDIIAITLEVNDEKLINRLERMGYLADVVIVLSEADRLFWSTYSSHVFVVPNPVDLYLEDKGITHPMEGSEIVWCGRFDPIKQPLKALDIFALVRRSVPDAHLTMVGAGKPSREDMERCASDLGVAESVTLTGYQADVMPYYRNANVFLMTSIAEGFPLVLTEALHEGLPSVAFELPYLSLASDNEGLVFAPQGDCETAAQMLVDILLDSNCQQEMSKAARAAYEKVCRIDFEELWKGIIREALESEKTGERSERSLSLTARDTEAFCDLVQFSVFETDRLVKHNAQEIDTLKRESELARSRCKEAQDVADALRKSVSFRIGRMITGPLRAVRDFLRKG